MGPPEGSNAFTDASLLFGTHSRIGTNTSGLLALYASGKITLRPNNATLDSSEGVTIDSAGLYPAANNTKICGSNNYKWSGVYATTFHGALDGNAATATKAGQDGDGNTISTTYVKKANITTSVSGTTLTLSFG